jgi:hypothetical protein
MVINDVHLQEVASSISTSFGLFGLRLRRFDDRIRCTQTLFLIFWTPVSTRSVVSNVWTLSLILCLRYRGVHPRLPLSAPPADSAPGETPAGYAHRMLELTRTVRELLAAAQAERKAKLDAGRFDTVFKVPGGPGAAADQGAARRSGYRQAAAEVGRPLHNHCLPWPQRLHTLPPSRGGCSAAPRSTSTGSSPSTSGSTPRRPSAQFRTRGRRASTRWSCCSTARRRGASRATWCGGAATRRRTASGCGRMMRWQSTTPPLPAAAGPAAGPAVPDGGRPPVGGGCASVGPGRVPVGDAG